MTLSAVKATLNNSVDVTATSSEDSMVNRNFYSSQQSSSVDSFIPRFSQESSINEEFSVCAENTFQPQGNTYSQSNSFNCRNSVSVGQCPVVVSIGISKSSFKEQNENDRSLNQIENDIKAMDMIYGSSFYFWIKNPANLQSTSKFLQKFLIEFSIEITSNVLLWIISNWSLKSSAELIIRTFITWGIGHPKCARAVNGIFKGIIGIPVILELCTALLAYETASNAAAFIRYLSIDWKDGILNGISSSTSSLGQLTDVSCCDRCSHCGLSVVELVKYVAKRLDWEPNYCRDFLYQFAFITENDFDCISLESSRIRSACSDLFTDKKFCSSLNGKENFEISSNCGNCCSCESHNKNFQIRKEELCELHNYSVPFVKNQRNNKKSNNTQGQKENEIKFLYLNLFENFVHQTQSLLQRNTTNKVSQI